MKKQTRRHLLAYHKNCNEWEVLDYHEASVHRTRKNAFIDAKNRLEWRQLVASVHTYAVLNGTRMK